jgi:hypothetical protein
MAVDGKTTDIQAHPELALAPAAPFGQDAYGELFISSTNGQIFRIEAAPWPP